MAALKRGFRPMNLGDILDEAFDLYKNNFVLMVGITAVFFLSFYFLMGMYFYSIFADLQVTSPTPEPPDMDTLIKMSALVLVFVLVFAIGSAAVTGALTYAISRRYLGEHATIGGSYGFIFKRIWPYVMTLMLYILAVAAPMVLALVAGAFAAVMGGAAGAVVLVLVIIAAAVAVVIIYLRLMFVTPVFILEGHKHTAALKRSWQLLAGHTGRVFGILFVTGIIVNIISSIVSSVVEFVIKPSVVTTTGIATRSAIDAVSTSLLIPITSIVLVLLYYDVRIRKEGFDLQMLARDLAAASGTEVPEQITTSVNQPSAMPVRPQPICAHCHFPIRTAEDGVRCQACGASLHRSCWAERGGCTTAGCPAAPGAGAPKI